LKYFGCGLFILFHASQPKARRFWYLLLCEVILKSRNAQLANRCAMRRPFIPLLFGIALLTVSISTYGAPWGWLVQKTSGSAVYVSTGTAQHALKKGLMLDRGATVRTGENGRVLLVRSQESVFIGPYTVAAIAARPTPGMQTTVLVKSGQASLAVRKKSRTHFSVETPYLVAVVKGTKFKVAVARSFAEVSVQEGRVEVRALKSGRYADVLAGQKAVVDAAGNLKLTGKGKFAAIRQGMPRGSIVGAGNLDGNATAQAGASIGGASVGVGASLGGGVSVGGRASVGGASVGVGASLGGGIGLGGL
jgi:FecR-like protein